MDAGPRRARPALTRISLDSLATRKSDGIRCPMHVAPLPGALAELLFLPAPCSGDRVASNGRVVVTGAFSFSFPSVFSGDVLEYAVHLDASMCWFSAKRPIQDGIETDGWVVCACCSGNGSGWAGQGFARFDEPAQPLHESQEIAGVFGRRHRKPDFGGR